MAKRVRKPRSVPVSDELRKIALWFIKPIVRYVNIEEVDNVLEKATGIFFNVDTRTVYFARALHKFRMPGRLEGHSSKINREVSTGAPLIVRIDETRPDRNEIVYRDQLFVLSQTQYSLIQERLEVVC